MSNRLREYVARGQVQADAGRAGLAWYGDWLAVGREHAMAPLPGKVGDSVQVDLMGAASRERLRRAEAALGGRQAPWYKLAHQVVLLEKPASEVAPLLQIEARSAMDVLRLTLGVIAGVYRLRE